MNAPHAIPGARVGDRVKGQIGRLGLISTCGNRALKVM
jgi:hypothetical protein